MKKIILLGIIILILTGCSNKEVKKEKQITETNGILSYTIDGEKTDIKPTKEAGYIVNKIICDNGSDIMWDNDNWEVELTKINSKDRCKVDFTKEISTPGYRVTVTSNMPSALDSLSKATTKNGSVIIYSKSKIENVTGCNGTIEDNKVVTTNVTQNQTCDIEVEDKTLATIIKKAYSSSGARNNFNVAYTTTALHTATDYDSSGSFSGTTYYFTGNTNNWVRFVGKLWRIIRINGNGSVRLLYAGTGEEDGYLTPSDIDSTVATNVVMNTNGLMKYNSSSNHPSYVGWKYTNSGTSGSLSEDRRNSTESPIYKAVSSWYSKNITSAGLTNYIDTSVVYCNDRNVGSGSYSTSAEFYYAGYSRLQSKKTPTLECNISDRFTPFGLMTADEVILAGGLFGNNNESVYYYLNSSGGSSTGSNPWWTMSPSMFYWAGGANYVTYVFVAGNILAHSSVYSSYVVRPVISLKPEVKVTSGDGSANSPYEILIE